MAKFSRRKFIGSSSALAAVGLGLPMQSTLSAAQAADTRSAPDYVIVNARVLTSDDSIPRAEAFAVKDDRFIAVGSSSDILNLASSSSEIIDAEGMTVTPGFIDLHTHSDLSFLLDSKAQSKVRQGVTMELIGNCGMSDAAPVRDHTKELLMMKLSRYGDAGDIADKIGWPDYAGYINASKKRGATLNIAFQVGHATIRSAVMGQEDRPPSADELSEMKRLAAESMDSGALGFSTGLYYAPGFYARTDEVIAIAEEVGKRNKLYSTHQRLSLIHISEPTRRYAIS